MKISRINLSDHEIVVERHVALPNGTIFFMGVVDKDGPDIQPLIVGCVDQKLQIVTSETLPGNINIINICDIFDGDACVVIGTKDIGPYVAIFKPGQKHLLEIDIRMIMSYFAKGTLITLTNVFASDSKIFLGGRILNQPVSMTFVIELTVSTPSVVVEDHRLVYISGVGQDSAESIDFIWIFNGHLCICIRNRRFVSYSPTRSMNTSQPLIAEDSSSVVVIKLDKIDNRHHSTFMFGNHRVVDAVCHGNTVTFLLRNHIEPWFMIPPCKYELRQLLIDQFDQEQEVSIMDIPREPNSIISAMRLTSLGKDMICISQIRYGDERDDNTRLTIYSSELRILGTRPLKCLGYTLNDIVVDNLDHSIVLIGGGFRADTIERIHPTNTQA